MKDNCSEAHVSLFFDEEDVVEEEEEEEFSKAILNLFRADPSSSSSRLA